jgi:hypothetical protein
MVSSGPDGIRTRDLGLDRAACSAATPRDLATGSLLYIVSLVKLRENKSNKAIINIMDQETDPPQLLVELETQQAPLGWAASAQ